MSLTLPKWLHHPFTTETLPLTPPKQTQEKVAKPSDNDKNTAKIPQTESLNYLDDYIHQWF